MNWVRRAVSIATEASLQKRRAEFLDTFTAMSFAFGGGEGAEVRFQNYLYSLMSEEELDLMEEAERVETQRKKERFVAQLMAMYEGGAASISSNAGTGSVEDQQQALYGNT